MKPGNVETSKGLAHIFEAAGYTINGLREAFRESAFCLECIFGLVLIVLAWCLPCITAVEAALLTASWLFVMVVELLNTAIEAVVDMVSPDYHPLAKRAKDLGSAAVAVAITTHFLLWLAFLVW